MNESSESMEEMQGQPTQAEVTEVECRPTKDPAVRWFIFAALMIGFATWCFIDRHKHPRPEAWDMKHVNEAAGYLFNNIIGPYIFFPAGLIIVIFAIRSLTRRLTADEEGIGYAGKAKVAWNDITGLDASELGSKQILRLRHGRDEVLTLDAYKLKNFRDLVAFIEAKVPEAAQPQADASPEDD